MPKPVTRRDASVNGMQEPADASKSSSEKASCLQTDLQVARERGKKRNLSSYSLRRHSKQPKYKSLYTLQHSANISEYFIRGWMQQKHQDCSGIPRSVTGLSYRNRCSADRSQRTEGNCCASPSASSAGGRPGGSDPRERDTAGLETGEPGPVLRAPAAR